MLLIKQLLQDLRVVLPGIRGGGALFILMVMMMMVVMESVVVAVGAMVRKQMTYSVHLDDSSSSSSVQK